MSSAERDAAYDNLGAVADSSELSRDREASSAVFRAEHPEYLDIPYGPKDRNRIDLFPATDPKAPCLVFIHGGYWQRNSREMFASLVAGPHAIGWSAALPGYTLAPDASLSEIVGEINASLDWLQSDGNEHGIAGPIILSGWSAGGHLTAMCLGHNAVSAGLSISGVFELGPIRDTSLNNKLRLTEAEIVALSPIRRPMVNKPLALAYGTAELPSLVSDSRNMHELRSALHLPGTLIPVPAANHFTIVNHLRDANGILTRSLPLLIN